VNPVLMIIGGFMCCRNLYFVRVIRCCGRTSHVWGRTLCTLQSKLCFCSLY